MNAKIMLFFSLCSYLLLGMHINKKDMPKFLKHYNTQNIRFYRNQPFKKRYKKNNHIKNKQSIQENTERSMGLWGTVGCLCAGAFVGGLLYDLTHIKAK